MPGFGPAAEVSFGRAQDRLFVSAKGPKTMLAVLWPFGFPARFADSGVAQTRKAQTMRAFSPVSAVLLGHTTGPGERAETLSPLNYSRPTRGVYPVYPEQGRRARTRPAG